MLALVRAVSLLFYFLLINAIILLVCILRPFHRDNVYVAAQLYSSMSWFVGMKVKVNYSDKLADGPYIFISNHQNSYDLISICRAVMPGTVSIGKKSLIWIPFFGQIYWLSGNIFIDRKNSAKASDTIGFSVQKMKEKALSIWVFPEGTRSRGRGLLPFKSGAFRMAKAANKAIVTVSISNLHNKISWNRWSNGTLLVDVGEPEGMDDSRNIKEWTEHFHNKMQKRIDELDQQLAESQPSN